MRSPTPRAVAIGLLLAAAASPLPLATARADTLATIRAHGRLDCAVSEDTDDFSKFDAHGDLSAFETDLCGAVAAAVLGDPKRAAIHAEHDEISGLRLVRDGGAQLMVGTTPDPVLGQALGLAFGPPVLIDGNGFLVDDRDGIRDLRGLAGKTVCWIDGTEAEASLPARMGELGIAYLPFPFQERGEMESALAARHCDAITGEITELANLRLSLKALRDHFSVMAQTYTVDPLAPAFAAGDPRFAAVVGAVMTGLVQAEEHGIDRSNVRALQRDATDPIRRRLLGLDPWIGPSLGLSPHFLADAVAAVGDQSEVFDRDVGAGSPLRLPTGPNRPVGSGGALVSLPVETGR